MHFECRYFGPIDKDRLLWTLDSWRPWEGRVVIERAWGVSEPESHLHYRPRLISRALVKIGINLLAHVCESTHVGRATFPEATAFARYDNGNSPDLELCGFVLNEDIQPLRCPPAAHSFRLWYDGGKWHLACSFFGGRIGATALFSGRSNEAWRTVDVVVPLRSRKWEIGKSKLLLPLRLRVEWERLNRMLPSPRLKNAETRMTLEKVRPTKKPK